MVSARGDCGILRPVDQEAGREVVQVVADRARLPVVPVVRFRGQQPDRFAGGVIPSCPRGSVHGTHRLDLARTTGMTAHAFKIRSRRRHERQVTACGIPRHTDASGIDAERIAVGLQVPDRAFDVLNLRGPVRLAGQAVGRAQAHEPQLAQVFAESLHAPRRAASPAATVDDDHRRSRLSPHRGYEQVPGEVSRTSPADDGILADSDPIHGDLIHDYATTSITLL